MKSSKIGRWVVAAGLALVTLAGSAGAAWALWRSEISVSGASVGVGQVYVSLIRLTPVVRESVADAVTPATLSVTSTDAVAVSTSSDGLAIPFRVDVKGDGHTGVDYSLELPNAVPGTVAEVSLFYLFPDTGTCSAVSVPGNAFIARPGQKIGPFLGQAPDTSTNSASGTKWCLVMRLDPAALGEFSNTATATATGPGGTTVTAQDQWWAKLPPYNPAANPPFDLVLEPLFTRSSTPARPAPSVT
ncbi:MAG: hypothetical protein LBJ62_00540 [Bifidobacteriaceae bacterium]|jgi:hypothetical protein|nr:hypothetical protein [Bifidobacteriaceae bacterium]